MTLWLTLLLMGLVTYAIRLSLIGVFGDLQVPPLITRALRFVPPAVLSAIILPELLRPDDRLDLSLTNARLLAGLLAADLPLQLGLMLAALMGITAGLLVVSRTKRLEIRD